MIENIQSGRQVRPPRILLAGGPGVGKTTFAASAPEPVFIPCDDGMVRQTERVMNTDRFPKPASYAEFLMYLRQLATDDHEYQTVVIDSITALQGLIWHQIAEGQGKDTVASIDYGRGYAAATEEFRKLVFALDWLRDNKGMASVCIAHTHVEAFSDPLEGAYDRWAVKLHESGEGRGGARSVMAEWSDAVLFAMTNTITKSEKGTFGKKETRALSTGERLLRCNNHPSCKAKNRYGMPDVLPLSWEAIAPYLAGSVTESN